MPLPTRPQRYRDPASLALYNSIHSIQTYDIQTGYNALSIGAAVQSVCLRSGISILQLFNNTVLTMATFFISIPGSSSRSSGKRQRRRIRSQRPKNDRPKNDRPNDGRRAQRQTRLQRQRLGRFRCFHGNGSERRRKTETDGKTHFQRRAETMREVTPIQI